MKASISCRFTALIADIKVRQTKQHPKDFISLRVNLLDDPEGEEPIWVSTFHDVADLKETLLQGQRIKIEGKIKPHRYTDSTGIERFIMKVDADEIALVLTGQEKEAAKAKEKERKAQKLASKEAQPALNLTDDDMFKSSAKLYQGPADMATGRKYERPFDDPLPF